MGKQQILRKTIQLFMLCSGTGLLMVGILTLLFIGAGAFLFNENPFFEYKEPNDTSVTVRDTSILAAFFFMSLGLGGALAWQGGRAILEQPSAPFHSAIFKILPYFYLPILVGGQWLLQAETGWLAQAAIYVFPLFHLGGAIISPLLVLIFAHHVLKQASLRWREIIIQLSLGALFSTILAIMAESIIGLIIFAFAVAVTLVIPGGLDRLGAWTTAIQNLVWMNDPEQAMQLLLYPPVLMTLLIVFVILAPMIEELTKFLGIALMAYRRPSIGQIYLWGIASGAGFAMVENLFNTIQALEFWVGIMLMRIGTSALHCLGVAILSLGWHHFLQQKRPWRLFGAYGLSVCVHALWNGLIIGLTVSLILSEGKMIGVLLSLGLGSLTFALFLVILASLIFLTYRVKTQLEKD